MNRREFLAGLAGPALLANTQPPAKITRIRISTLQGRFHKFVAMNAYDQTPKGHTYEHSLFRIETDQGVEGIGAGNYSNFATPEGAAAFKPLIGANVFDLYQMDAANHITGRAPGYATVLSRARFLDSALYDLIGKLTGKAAWQLIGESVRERVPVYDGTLYFSDVWFKDRGIRAVAEECEEAAKSGYGGVKIKLGRGDKWMEREAGDRRDIEVTRAVRKAIGPGVKLMADPNYGYRNRVDAALRLMNETREAGLYWMEEIFPETVEGYATFRRKLSESGNKTLIAAGEHMREPREFEPYLKPARLMDVLQMDIRQGGFLDNAAVSRMAAAAGSVAIPHNWGSQIGTFMGLHLARASQGVPMVESDRSTCDVLITDAYQLEKGMYRVPSTPGLSIGIDGGVYDRKCKPSEIVVS
jgi:L-alanine-DL-glutamate epimerase-like enolase superfamily enzyme